MLCYCCIVYLIVHLYSTRYIFYMSRRNTTFLSKVGETGVGEQGISRPSTGVLSICEVEKLSLLPLIVWTNNACMKCKFIQLGTSSPLFYLGEG